MNYSDDPKTLSARLSEQARRCDSLATTTNTIVSARETRLASLLREAAGQVGVAETGEARDEPIPEWAAQVIGAVCRGLTDEAAARVTDAMVQRALYAIKPLRFATYPHEEMRAALVAALVVRP